MFSPTLCVLALVLAIANSQKICTGVISNGNGPNPITSDVLVPAGSTCTINGVNITGSVFVQQGAGLSTIGKSRVFGVINAIDCGSLFLTGKLSVSGGVSVTKCKQVDVGKQANVGSLTTVDTGSVILQGSVALLSVRGNGNLIISGGKVMGGGILRQGAIGSTTLCGATILGGIKMEAVTGDFNAAASAACGPSDISGTIEIGKGTGSLKVGGGMLLGADLIVFNQKGNVDFFNSHLSDVSIKSVTGFVKLNGIQADSDAGISGVTKTITVTKSSFDGDFGILNNPGGVTITGNEFTLEDLLISGNGFVSIKNNANFSFVATENKGISITDNKFITTASISKNTVSTSILRNSFTSLSCADNAGSFSGAGNSVIFGTGQCAKF